MTEPQDFNSLDELFRKTFDNLPETPAPSGWDRPSDRVWQHVQATVKPPRSGWSTKAITLVSALAVTVAIGLYLFVIRPETPAETNAPAEQPTVATAPNVVTPAETVAAIPAPEKMSVQKQTAAPAIQARQREMPAPKTSEAQPATGQRPTGSIPLPGSKSAPPNTTVLNMELIWKTPLETLPVLPESIDRLPSKGLEKY
jgi:hypothetical protein